MSLLSATMLPVTLKVDCVARGQLKQKVVNEKAEGMMSESSDIR